MNVVVHICCLRLPADSGIYHHISYLGHFWKASSAAITTRDVHWMCGTVSVTLDEWLELAAFGPQGRYSTIAPTHPI